MFSTKEIVEKKKSQSREVVECEAEHRSLAKTTVDLG